MILSHLQNEVQLNHNLPRYCRRCKELTLDLIHMMVKLDSLQERLQKLEERPLSSSISSSDASVTKRRVPPEVRVILFSVHILLLLTYPLNYNFVIPPPPKSVTYMHYSLFLVSLHSLFYSLLHPIHLTQTSFLSSIHSTL